MAVKIYSQFDESLKDVWCDLERSGELYGFQTYDWLGHWYRKIGGPLLGIRLQIVAIYQQGQLCAILPLGIRNLGGIRILGWLGGLQTDYHAPVLSSSWSPSEDEFIKFWEEIPKFDLTISLNSFRERELL